VLPEVSDLLEQLVLWEQLACRVMSGQQVLRVLPEQEEVLDQPDLLELLEHLDLREHKVPQALRDQPGRSATRELRAFRAQAVLSVRSAP